MQNPENQSQKICDNNSNDFSKSFSPNSNDDKIAKETNKNNISNLTIIIKNNNFRDIQLQVTSDILVKDIIEKYKNKLEKNINDDIGLKKGDGSYLPPKKTLCELGIKNMENIFVENEEEYIKRKEKEEFKKIIKEKLKKGLYTIAIRSSDLKNEYYFVRPNIKFEVLAEEFKAKNPNKKCYFLFQGKKVDEKRTLEELNIKHLSVIITAEYI